MLNCVLDKEEGSKCKWHHSNGKCLYGIIGATGGFHPQCNQFEPRTVRRCYICNAVGGTFNITGGHGEKGDALCDQCNDLYNDLVMGECVYGGILEALKALVARAGENQKDL